MERKGRREEYAATTRTAILDAAAQHFASHGFAGSSVNAIAEDARVTKGAVYHHFKDKTALFEAVFIALEDELVTSVVMAAADLGDPVEQLAAGVDLFLRRCGDPGFRRIVLEDAPAALGWDRWKELEETRFHGLVAATLGAFTTLDSHSIRLASSMFLAALGEAGIAVARSQDPETERRQAALLILRIARGLQ